MVQKRFGSADSTGRKLDVIEEYLSMYQKALSYTELSTIYIDGFAGSGEVLLADPAFGNVTMSIEKFMKGWISYRDIERVGFFVKKAGQQVYPGKLSAEVSDFMLLRQP